jgi:hypothetical protein
VEFRNDVLEQCDRACRGGFPLIASEGALVGRGFADIGYELYVVLPGHTLLSLMTGSKTPFREEEHPHFFSVPTVDQVVHEIERSGSTLLRCERIDGGRAWEVIIAPEGATKSEQYQIARGEELLTCLLEFYCDESAV